MQIFRENLLLLKSLPSLVCLGRGGCCWLLTGRNGPLLQSLVGVTGVWGTKFPHMIY